MTLKKLVFALLGALVAQVLMAAPALAYNWTRDLSYGATGKDVKALQVRVAGWYPANDQSLFEIDGTFDDDTKVAVEAFQQHYGLTPDGVAGADTFKALNALEDEDHTTVNFDFSEFWQNRNSSCSAEANQYASSFRGGMVSEKEVKKNVRRLMWRLEALRAKVGDKPIAINSGFRSVAYNRCIRGATYSQHMYGTAADMRIVGVSNRKGRDTAKGSQVHGIGCYSSMSHNHMDLRMQNEALGGAQYWWWPERDEYDRDLASDDLPCYGEIKRDSSVSAAGAAVESASYEMAERWTQAELNEWKAEGEADNLHGLD
ncbi:MAG: M15 family metallopeptidase [Actinomycetota bacterium]|nr:M15 family metallopeptidase [Actinomycetota bacterium]